MSLKGNTGFKWTPPGGTETTHALNYPPFIQDYTEKKTRWRHEKTPYAEQPTFTLGSAIGRITLRLRLETSANALLDFLEDGADGVQIDYYPDLSQSTHYPSWVVETGELVEVRQDADRYPMGEYEKTVTLKHANGGTYRGIL